MPRDPVVAVIIEPRNEYRRGLIRGVLEYVQAHRRWSLVPITVPPNPAWARKWRGDGALCHALGRRFTEALVQSGLPVVEIDRWHGPGCPYLVGSDQGAIGRLAFEHLRECRLKSFAFCGFKDARWSLERKQGFQKAVEATGLKCLTFESPFADRGPVAWAADQHRLARWLRKLPRPAGVMACNDLRGQHLLLAAREANLAVPHDLAVIGVDNDELLCNLCDPPLSSVAPNTQQIGYRAAELLAQLMSGKRPRTGDILFPPTGLARRRSTDLVAGINDPEFAAVLADLHAHACEGITVPQLLKQHQVSRTWLERRSRQYLGRSPHEEIRKLQVRRVCQLLAETDRTLAGIAAQTGFKHVEYLVVVFKREMGQTPGQYRRERRGADRRRGRQRRPAPG